MSRISLKEQYDNKDVIQQMYIVKDDQQVLDEQMQETQQQVSAMQSQVDIAQIQANNALVTAQSFESRVSSNTNRIAQAENDIDGIENELADTQSRVDECIVSLTVNSTEANASLKYMKASEQNLSVAFPIASPTKTGMMNAQTYAGLQNLQDRVNRLEAVATVYYVQFASDDPNQEAITTAFQSVAGRPPTSGDYATDIARALTYGYNGSMWIKVEQSSSIPLFTNDTPGLIKGSVEDGTVQAEPDGTGSVNGWDELTSNVNNAMSDISNLQTSNAGKQKSLIPVPVTIPANLWQNNQCTVTVQGVTSMSIVWVAPGVETYDDYLKSNVVCIGQEENKLTFKCKTVPSDNVIANVVIG